MASLWKSALCRNYPPFLSQQSSTEKRDVYVAECPKVGTASQGDTVEEVLTKLREATELYLKEFPLSENLLLRAIFAFPIT
jgi:predicted RNase H-like HicB family nuclease